MATTSYQTQIRNLVKELITTAETNSEMAEELTDYFADSLEHDTIFREELGKALFSHKELGEKVKKAVFNELCD